MRRAARVLGVNRKTIGRRFIRLSMQARIDHKAFSAKIRELEHVQFDEMESFEHTKCKPLSIAMGVSAHSRFILSVKVARMPCKGRLAKISLKKYGKRPEERRKAMRSMLEELKPMLLTKGTLSSDLCPRYAPLVKGIFPDAIHKQYKGRKPIATGQGELKQGPFDPLFWINHTAGMARDGIQRLVRKTWATSKLAAALEDHYYLYADYHNRVLVA
jgi:hypothetical protein